MAKLRSLIITGFGINCEAEMHAAYKQLGVDAEIVHLSLLFSEEVSLLDFDIVNFPGGFSYGDDLGAGRVLANLIKYKKLPSGKTFFECLLEYIDSGKTILGICNGFQILLVLGLLPGLNPHHEQEAALVVNDAGKFDNRWVSCQVPKGSLAAELFPSDVCEFPIRNKEGKLVIKNNAVAEQIKNKGLIALQYCDNPNNSWMGAAGLIHPNKRIIGLMPHPEAALSRYHHPNWKAKENSDRGDGYWFLKKMIDFIVHEKEQSRCIQSKERLSAYQTNII